MHDRATGLLGLKILKKFVESGNTGNELVCVTQALKLALEEQIEMPIAPEMTVIAPNGVDTERFEQLPDRQTARSQLNLEEQFTVSYTGHFYAGRGLDVLFALAEAFPLVHFLWIGGRDQELTPVRSKLDIRKLTNVMLTGFIENKSLPLYQAASDVLLMPYERRLRAAVVVTLQIFAAL